MASTASVVMSSEVTESLGTEPTREFYARAEGAVHRPPGCPSPLAQAPAGMPTVYASIDSEPARYPSTIGVIGWSAAAANPAV